MIIPQTTRYGFQKAAVPVDAWDLIQTAYAAVMPNLREENFAGKSDVIKGMGCTSDIMTLDQLPGFQGQLLEALRPMHEEFCSRQINPHCIYGIRSYNRGASLVHHVDRVETHHISSILIVDKDLSGGSDWPLEIQSHDGSWHEVFAQPGEMILYESALCLHGRTTQFTGRWFRNLFVHYSLT